MPRFATILAVAALLALPLVPADAQRKRSLVGRKLPDITYVDTEGHQIRPRDYEGSVLVMLAGIPW